MQLNLDSISYAYPTKSNKDSRVNVLDNLDLKVNSGEFFTLLGPSGCGKTTLLWIIAGFFQPSFGNIYINNKLITLLPPEKRSMGIVFQNYALFPNLTVYENIAYGLRTRKVPSKELAIRVDEMLELVNLTPFAKRKPENLSGGQQQRVALARAIAPNPDVLLMDEPLSNLDASLREETRLRIQALQRNIKTTTIYVTHDQEEALALSDRIAIMKDGSIQQIDTPFNIFNHPINKFVASFVGRCNFVNITINPDNTFYIGNDSNIKHTIPKHIIDSKSGSAILAIRPHHISIHSNNKDANSIHLNSIIINSEFHGESYLITTKAIDLSINEITILMPPHFNSFNYNIGDHVTINMSLDKVEIFSDEK